LPAADLVFSAPATVAEAVAQLGGGDAIVMGGGTSVAMLLKNDLIEPGRIVWLGKVPELRRLTVGHDGTLVIGATVTLRELAAAAPVRKHAPALAYAASQVGNPRVRAVATLGGALAHGDPRQDVPPVLLALEARARVAGPSGEREVPLAGFHTGFMETILAEDEIVTEIVIPAAAGRRAAYARFTPGSEDDYPTVGVAASVVRAGDGTVTGAVLALGGVGPAPMLVDGAAALAGRVPGQADIEAVAAAAEETAAPFDDQRGSARYKKAMAREWTRRALRACLDGAGQRPGTGPAAG
jgi:aerobic carbon-monoxide dehydrogenase medium subunit